MSQYSDADNAFTILGFDTEDIGLDEAKKTCQRLLLKLHPDKNGGQESEEYHRVLSVWKQLAAPADSATRFMKQQWALLQADKLSRLGCEGDNVLVTDLTASTVRIDGHPVEALVQSCRCGGLFLITRDTIAESQSGRCCWQVECDSCSLSITILKP